MMSSVIPEILDLYSQVLTSVLRSNERGEGREGEGERGGREGEGERGGREGDVEGERGGEGEEEGGEDEDSSIVVDKPSSIDLPQLNIR